MIGERRVQAMERFVADATQRGARVLTGGARTRGFHFPPTVLADVPDDAEVMREEPFGPIAPLAPFADWEDALARANALPTASPATSSPTRSGSLSRRCAT